MDEKDKKILSILDKDSRMSSSQIAKKTRLSRQVVDYRINNLVKEGIIKNFITIIDPTKFVDNVWHVYVKLQSLNRNSEERMFRYLGGENRVWWFANCQGEWDLIFSFAGNSIIEFDNFLLDFRSHFSKFIREEEISSFIKADLFSRGYFEKKSSNKKEYVGERGKIKIDSKDLKILKILSINARMSSVDIADKTNLTARQVIYRIKDLEKRKVIRAFKLQLSLEKFNYDHYKVCFYTENFTSRDERKILDWCESNNHSLYFVKKIAPWTFEIEFEVEGYKELNSLLKEMNNEFGEGIKRFETTLIEEEFKGELNILGIK